MNIQVFLGLPVALWTLVGLWNLKYLYRIIPLGALDPLSPTIPLWTLPFFLADCSLRRGAGGTEFARFGSRTCFLRWFYKRSQTYFGQKPEEHGFSIKKRCLEIKNDDFWEKYVTLKKGVFFLNFSRSSRARAGPIWAHKGPYGSIWVLLDRSWRFRQLSVETFRPISHVSDLETNFCRL